jgi:hypothetical protein
MLRTSDAVIERARVREVTGIFHSRRALEDTVDALLLSGFDRADIDRVASLDEIPKRLGGVYIAPEELADVPQAPRAPFFSVDDISTVKAVVAGIVAPAVALGFAFAVVAWGMTSIWAIAGIALAGAVGGGIGSLLITHYLGREHRDGLDTLMAARGLILWVRVRSPDREERALRILQENGAEAVRVHEIEIGKRPDDIPLSSLRPDPWLGDERLGQP